MDEILRINNLSVEYRAGIERTYAVNNLDMVIHKGEAFGLVGESGAGKTTIALSIMRLLPEKVGFVTGGDIVYQGESLLQKEEKELLDIRGNKISMVFQNPLTSLNPVFTVGHQISISLSQHRHLSRKQAEEEGKKLLEMVGISGARYSDYPHQFSGGMRQRVGIAAALACSPELLIMDEPTTALDVTIQAQILELTKDLQKKYNTSMLLITHNLGIISELCQKVAVIYGGSIVEYGTVSEVFRNPQHPYTVGLLGAVPQLHGERKRLVSIPGNVANAQNLPDGCRFHPRCAYCTEQCKVNAPVIKEINSDHYVSCWERK